MKRLLSIVLFCLASNLFSQNITTELYDSLLQNYSLLELKQMNVSPPFNYGKGPHDKFPAQPEQDCAGAIPVCQNTFSQTNSYSDYGAIQEVSGTCLGDNEKNSVWYTMNIQAGGILAFDINPNTNSDDYDFALYDMTNNVCADIPNMSAVRCNFSVTSGQTGIGSAGSNNSEDSGGPTYSNDINVSAGESYILIISNYSSSSDGYTLDFGNSTATIFDASPPVAINAFTPCGSNQITIELDEFIECSSIATDGSDFSLTGPSSPTIVSVAGVNCGTRTNSIIITLSAPLQTGANYDLTILTGTDGNTLTDLCGNSVADPTVFNFNQVNVPASITGVTAFCTGDNITLTGHDAGTYVWSQSGGSSIGTSQTLIVTTGGTYDLEVTDACGNVTTASHTVTENTPEIPVLCYDPTTGFVVATGGSSYNWFTEFCIPIIGCSEILDLGSLGQSQIDVSGDPAANYAVQIPGNICNPKITFIPTNLPLCATVPSLSVCVETNGDLSVSAGTSPYIWEEWVTATSTPITNSSECTSCGGSWTPFINTCTVGITTITSCDTPGAWIGFGSGTTITLPAPNSDTIKVTDATGAYFIINGIGSLLPCTTTCDATITAAGPFCVTDAAINLTAAQTGGNWTGTGITNASNGTFDPATAGVGSHTITYTLPTCNDNITIIVTPLPNAGNNGTAVLCANATTINLEDSLSGSPDAGGTWSPALTSGTGAFNPATDGAGTYTYTVTNSCGSDSKTVIVSINPLPITGTNGTAILCAGATAVNLEDSLGGSPDAGGTWSPALTSGTGVFDPANDAVTTYMYTVTSSCGTSSNDVVVTINPLPNTGADGAITMCSTDPSTDLFTQLGAGADAGGSWLPAMTSGTGVFDPATDAAGTYTYTVTNSCGTSSNDVVVTISANPLPGTNGSANLCSNASSVNLVDSLGGSPSAGGTWSPALTSGTGVFDPTTDVAGTYTYSVNDCSGTPQTADVVVTIISAPNTGTNGTAILCSNASTVNLEDSLVGSPDAGGTWLPALTSGTGVFDPATDAAGTYTYSITNSCGTVSSDVVVTINPNLVPGTNGTANLCSNASSINLMDSLNGSPDAGGTWSPVMTSGTGVFDPTTDAAGTYTYSVNDCNGTPQTADVVVTIISAPNTGADGAITFCPADAASDLFTQLGAGADAGGIWSPAMTSGTGMFDPATDAAGTYTYTVTNSCGSSSNDVVVTISTNPSAGTNGTANLCTNASSINLLDSLGGTPSAGGTWSPALTSGTSVFNPTTDGAGTYTYSINDCSGNPLTATVIVSTIPGPDAGTNGAITFCSTDAATDLFTQLGGTPNTGGSWSPTMASGTGVFDPTTDAATTYTYTVTNSCGSANSNVIVTVNTCTTPQAGYTVSDSTICEGDCITITDASTSGSSWSWTFNGGTPPSSNLQNPGTVCYNAAGTYTIEQTVTNSFGSNTATSTIEVFATPIIDAGIDVSLELGESTTLDASGAGVNAVYTWSPTSWLSCVICPTTITTPEETIIYTVTAVDTNGCTATDDVTVIVNYDNVIWVPNIFSPNGDGNNDYLFVRGKGVESFQFVVYSRWGEKVFESTSLTDGWNGRFRGKDMNKAVFVYYLKGFFKDGSEFNQKGDITLIR